MRRTVIPLLTLCALLGTGRPAQAQIFDDVSAPLDTGGLGPHRASIALIVARPIGEFSEYVDLGWGVAGSFALALDPHGIFALRAGFDFLNYGNETKRVPLSPTLPRIRVDVNTSNNIGGLNIGAQLASPVGAIRPYVNGSFGFNYFWTQSSVEGSNNDNDPFATSTNYDDFTRSWAAGAGFFIPIRKGSTPVSLDLGARYVNNGRTRYLREGSIQDSGTDIYFTPIESETNLLVYQLGLSFGGRARRR